MLMYIRYKDSESNYSKNGSVAKQIEESAPDFLRLLKKKKRQDAVLQVLIENEQAFFYHSIDTL